MDGPIFQAIVSSIDDGFEPNGRSWMVRISKLARSYKQRKTKIFQLGKRDVKKPKCAIYTVQTW